MITGFTDHNGVYHQGMNDFKASIGAFVADTAKKHMKMQVDTCMMLLNQLKKGTGDPGTPVDTRWASNNWWFAIGPNCPTEPRGSYPGTHHKGAYGNADHKSSRLSIENPNKGILNGAKPFGTMWVYNNVPYIEVLEDGHSKQAPMGFAYNALVALEVWLQTKKLEDSK